MEFAGAYVLCTGKQELYRKFLPRLNSVCMSQTRRRVWEPFGREFTSSAEAPARGTPYCKAAKPPTAIQRVSLGEEEQGSGVKCSPGGGNGAERTLRRRGRRPDRRRVSEGPGHCGDRERGEPGVRSAEGRRTGELRQGADEKTGDGRSPKRHFSRSLDLAARPCAQPIA